MNDVLLVDDEGSVLKNLVNALDWPEYGFKSVHAASSAREALQILQTHAVDLLISDILMPDITGLEMLKTVRAQYPDTHCVLISAHSKFEYAKEALQMGVENYILKPIDIEELKETVYATAENIRKTVRITRDLFDKNILERWLRGRITMDELAEHSQYARLNVFMRRYCALVVEAEGGISGAMARVCEGLGVDLAAYTLETGDHTGVVLAGGRDLDTLTLREAASGVLSRDANALVVCGSFATGNGEVAQSLLDAQHARAWARLTGARGWVDFHTIVWNPVSGEKLGALANELRLSPSRERVRAWALSLCEEGATPDFLRGAYAQICIELPRMLPQDVYSGRSAQFEGFRAPYTRERLCEMLENAVLLLCEHNRARAKELSPITMRVVKYIGDNLSGAISIKQFCEQAHMNAGYIGRLFKDETGVYFSDYVCAARIRTAKRLLETTALSVSNIARQVGMYDVSYFTRCFREQERLSPLKYRQRVLQGETPQT